MPESELFITLIIIAAIVYIVSAIALCVVYNASCEIRNERPSRVMMIFFVIMCVCLYYVSFRVAVSMAEEITAEKLLGYCLSMLIVVMPVIIGTIWVVQNKKDRKKGKMPPALNLENADESSDDKKHYKITWGGDKPYTYEEFYIYDVWLDDD